MNVPSDQETNRLHADICQALADPKRILILYALADEPRHVSALAEALDLPQPTASRHLRILRQQSLVFSHREGPSVVYSLADERIIEILEMIRALMLEGLARQADFLEANSLA